MTEQPRIGLWAAALNAAVGASESGEFAKAERLLEVALAEAERTHESRPRIAITLNLLGSVYLETGRWRDAETCDRRAILIWERDPYGKELSLCRALENLEHFQRYYR